MSYLVFARKYRPQGFEDVLGQEHVARTLRNAIEGGRLAHAYLFTGPRGVGKTTMARILAKAINCPVRPGPSPCGECEVCRGIAAGGDVDVLEIDAASNRQVEDAEKLTDATRYLPQRCANKIFIVDEFHMLSKHAFNALLKTLEEPPPHVTFIFATTEPHKIPETIRSRCQRFDFKRISTADIAGKLRRIAAAEGAPVEEAVFDEIARRATGGMRDAESMFDQVLSGATKDRALSVRDLIAILGGIPRDLRTRLLAALRGGDARAALDLARSVVDEGADPGELLRDLYADLRDAAVEAATGQESALGLEWCLGAAELVGRHLHLAERSRSARAALDLALLALSRLGDVRDLEELVERLERLSGTAPVQEAGPAASPPPPAPGAPPASPRTSPFAGIRNRLQSGTLEPPPPPAENVAPPTRAMSGEELAKVRSHPLVREALSLFGGQIEHVRRNEDGEGVR